MKTNFGWFDSRSHFCHFVSAFVRAFRGIVLRILVLLTLSALCAFVFSLQRMEAQAHAAMLGQMQNHSQTFDRNSVSVMAEKPGDLQGFAEAIAQVKQPLRSSKVSIESIARTDGEEQTVTSPSIIVNASLFIPSLSFHSPLSQLRSSNLNSNDDAKTAKLPNENVSKVIYVVPNSFVSAFGN